ncbi:hypothetical protein TrLO_g5419 [Triparma laevis f. longispina]|uniref:Glutaredoxin domain-containing protein n=1 Tax=Triparma laevis f. longispina TaxID=1714387 RepID=A0A9W7FLF0_9STRA|nr:hypothetical protein TrLO_g5419 [Triparma laevis f. longispina]
MKDDASSYLLEYWMFLSTAFPCLKDGKSEGALADESKLIDEKISNNDVVLVGKGGCGYCKRAKETLANAQTTTPFAMDIYLIANTDTITAAGEKVARQNIKSRLNLFDLTFPQIIVAGQYIGGADDLTLLVESGEFDKLVLSDKPEMGAGEKIQYEATLKERSSKPDLFKVPKVRGTWYPDWPFYSFQWAMYSNLVRYISILHLILMGVTVSLIDAQPEIANALIFFYFVDLCIIVIFGPVPSFCGTVSMYFGWKMRGNATSTLPYKVVFLAYVYGLLHVTLYRCFGMFEDWGEDNDSNKYIKTRYAGFIVNSGTGAIVKIVEYSRTICCTKKK